jgi:flagellar protein FlaG
MGVVVMPMTTLDAVGPVPAQAVAGSGVSAPAERAAHAAAEAPKPAPAAQAVAAAVAHANRALAELAPSLEFELDGESHRVVVRLVDREDRRVIRQYPSEEMLAIARALERMQGALIDERI